MALPHKSEDHPTVFRAILQKDMAEEQRETKDTITPLPGVQPSKPKTTYCTVTALAISTNLLPINILTNTQT